MWVVKVIFLVVDFLFLTCNVLILRDMYEEDLRTASKYFWLASVMTLANMAMIALGV